LSQAKKKPEGDWLQTAFAVTVTIELVLVAIRSPKGLNNNKGKKYANNLF
jgi:hypothetical protein